MKRNEFLCRTHRKTLGHHALSESLHLSSIGETQKRAGVSCRDHIRSKPPLHQRRQLHETQGVGNLRTRPSDSLGELRVSALEVLQQLLVGRSLFQGIELDTVQVLQQRVTQQVDVIRVPNDCRNRLQAGFLGGPQTTLTHNELIPQLLSRSSRHLPHHDWLQQAHFRNRGRQFRNVLLIEDLTGLAGVRVDQFHRNLSETGSRHGHKTISIRCVLLAIGFLSNIAMRVRGIRRRSLLGLLILRTGGFMVSDRGLLLLRFT